MGMVSEAPAIKTTPVSDATSHGRRPLRGLSVLVTDEHYKHTLGIVRRLGQLEVQVSLMAASIDNLAGASRHCRNVIPVASPGTEPLLEAILRAIKNRKYDVLLPVGYKTTLALAQRREEFTPFVRLELADST